MSVPTAVFSAFRWSGNRLDVLDQTRLPHAEAWVPCTRAADVADAIRRLAVRGAPNIGIAAAYGVALEVAAEPEGWRPGVAALRAARPTAVNLAWAVDRVAAAAPGGPAAAREAAEALHAAEDAASERVALAGAALLAELGVRTVLTHCNTGVLACAAGGSALGCAITHVRATPGASVLACETRPLLQGARLTAWELDRAGVPHALLADGAAAGLIARGEVDAVIVGTDRVAANGDVANKVGTYAHALAAQAAGIPFLVAGPVSSIDLALAHGNDIEIEERDADEVRRTPGGELLTLAGTPVRNPAFDVTPAALVTALVTEHGTARPVSRATIAELAGRE
jgi:methylthioribose-1-phosphate isomerase